MCGLLTAPIPVLQSRVLCPEAAALFGELACSVHVLGCKFAMAVKWRDRTCTDGSLAGMCCVHSQRLRN